MFVKKRTFSSRTREKFHMNLIHSNRECHRKIERRHGIRSGISLNVLFSVETVENFKMH